MAPESRVRQTAHSAALPIPYLVKCCTKLSSRGAKLVLVDVPSALVALRRCTKSFVNETKRDMLCQTGQGKLPADMSRRMQTSRVRHNVRNIAARSCFSGPTAGSKATASGQRSSNRIGKSIIVE